MAMAIRILPRLVHVEFVVGVLHEGDAQPLAHEHGDDLLDEGRLAASAIARDSKDLHKEKFTVPA